MKHPSDSHGPAPDDPPPYAPAHRQLLHAVTELIGDGRTHPLTAERVAEQAGLRTEMFFTFFGDAEDSVVAAHDVWLESGIRCIERPRAAAAERLAEGDARRRVEALLVDLVGALYRGLAERPDVAWLCLVATPALGERGLAARDRVVDRLRRTLEQQLAFLGLSPRSGTLACRMAAGGIYDTAQRFARDHDTERLPAVVPDVAQAWARVLRDGGPVA